MTVRDDVLELYADVTLSAANQVSAAHDVGSFTEALIVISVTATTGTNETLDLDVEVSDDQTLWYKLEDIAQITAIGRVSHQVTAPFGKFIRINSATAPGGTGTPTFTLSASLMVKGT